MAQAVKTLRQVKPILSTDKNGARSRVITLYKAWYRQIPSVVFDYDIPKTVPECRAKLRELFEKNKNVEDIRVIDLLVIKGQMELQETERIWKQKGHIMTYFKESQEPPPTDFLSKFFQGS
ncbi:NADH dehydrogenase [ubiquinone] 1 alpha subcomplex subunit 6 [Chrysoperla carnea]|uniref:NADH dehydrogenase [ubiquinone] 1 alpha subcomplex subunit 6 n=1 Tax=Chrysoperla carnea TaxID=189513 RepID=UPI001D08F983|nr:NADH dehydrogenase [ubiquinone] 1 alpha subcomplex subunit 6 [Chrysoperla carnea]